MQRLIKILPILLLTQGLWACQSGVGVSGPATGGNPSAMPSSGPASPVPGGFFAQNPDDSAMQAIFRSAEKLLQAKYPAAGIRLTKLKQISSQVVAGANYRLDADYTDAKGTGSVTLTVYRNLQDQQSLSEDNYKP